MNRSPLVKTAAAAFSLVEVVLALGICSFAMVAIIGMIPVGLSTFSDAMSTTVQSQIMQSIASEALLTDYENLNTEVVETFYNDQGAPRDNALAADLAYTVRVLPPQPLGQDPETGGITAGEKVVIMIARTRPGQFFETIASNSPSQIHRYSVIVANGKP